MSLSKQDKNSENKYLHEAFKYLTNKCLNYFLKFHAN